MYVGGGENERWKRKGVKGKGREREGRDEARRKGGEMRRVEGGGRKRRKDK